MKKRINCILLISIFLLNLFPANIFAEDTNVMLTSDFVDLKFTIGKVDYISKKISKKMDIAPDIVEGRTVVPFRNIFEELGYKVEWDSELNAVKATDSKNTILLKIGEKIAKVNNEDKELDVPPTIIKGRTVVPLRFVSEYSGATVKWDADTKTILVTRLGNFNSGSLLFYDQQSKTTDKRNAYIYNGSTLVTVSLMGKEIKNTLPYNGSILITLLDSSNDNYNLVQYVNGEFKVLLENFEIINSLEFNNNLIINGYDRTKKIYHLYRFTGSSLVKIQEDFTMGTYQVYKEKLFINKYDSYRNYSIMTIDKNWKMEELGKDVMIREKLLEDDVLFLATSSTISSNKPFMYYNGVELVKLHDNLDIDLKRTVSYNQIFDGAKLNCILTVATAKKTGATKAESYFVALLNKSEGSKEYELFDMSVDSKIVKDAEITTSPTKYTVDSLKVFNDELFIAVKETKSIFKSHNLVKIEINNPDIIKTSLAGTGKYLHISETETLHKKLTFKSMDIQGKHILIHYQNNDDKIYYYYIYRKTTGFNYEVSLTRDIESITKVKYHMDKLFLDVKDIDRLTGKTRSALIVYDPVEKNVDKRIRNLVLGLETKRWEALDGAMVINGYEADIKRNKVYIYKTGFEEILSNFEVNYWRNINDTIYTSGTDTDSKKTDLYQITSSGNKLIKNDVQMFKIEKGLGDYFYISLSLKSSKPLFSGKGLFIWDAKNNKFVDIATGVELSDIIYF